MSATGCYDTAGNRPLRFPSQPMRESYPKMKWNERIAASFDARGVNRAEVGREIGITGQAITLKLQGKRPTYVEELKIMSRWAGMTVAEALGDDAVVIEVEDEMDLVELYRLMTPEQRQRWVAIGRDVAGPRKDTEESE